MRPGAAWGGYEYVRWPERRKRINKLLQTVALVLINGGYADDTGWFSAINALSCIVGLAGAVGQAIRFYLEWD